MKITEFLLRRIAEDEREAEVWLRKYRRGEGVSAQRWKRVLRECEAKRAIVRSYASFTSVAEKASGFGERLSASSAAKGFELAVAMLAAVYRDHPDHQPEWANSTTPN